MKLLVFADSHGDVETMKKVARQEAPDMILHLGDHAADAQALERFVSCPLRFVKGNTDFGQNGQTERLFTLANRRIYITHGHLHHVKRDLSALKAAGIAHKAHLVLFGHTHQPHIGLYESGLQLMNPGRIGRRIIQSQATYGIILLKNDGDITCKIISAE